MIKDILFLCSNTHMGCCVFIVVDLLHFLNLCSVSCTLLLFFWRICLAFLALCTSELMSESLYHIASSPPWSHPSLPCSQSKIKSFWNFDYNYIQRRNCFGENGIFAIHGFPTQECGVSFKSTPFLTDEVLHSSCFYTYRAFIFIIFSNGSLLIFRKAMDFYVLKIILLYSL